MLSIKKKKKTPGLKFNPGLALTGVRTTGVKKSPQKSHLKSSHPKNYSPNFPPQKILEWKISNTKKSFDHPHHLKSRELPWEPPTKRFYGLHHSFLHRQPKRASCGFGLQRSFGRNILELLVYYLMPNKCKKS